MTIDWRGALRMAPRAWYSIPLLLVLAAGLSIAAYLPQILQLEYVWDDWHLFLANPGLRIPEHIWSAALKPILPETTYFRPLPLLSLALEFRLFGVDPAVSHGFNLALHAVNTLLVGLIAAKLVTDLPVHSRAWRVWLGTLFYGLHPAMIEPVSWTAGRFDLMATTFMLAAVWGYMVLTGWPRAIWTILCFFFAALSKEMAATLPVVLLIFYIARMGAEKGLLRLWHEFWQSGEWRLYAGLFLTGIVYLAFKTASIGALAHADYNLKAQLEGPAHHLAFIGQTLWFYVKMSIFPFADLSPQHPYNVAEMTQAARVVGWLTLTLIVTSTVLALRTHRTWLLLWLAYLVSLLPVLHIIPLTIGGNIGHERFLVFPLSLFALSLATLRFELNLSQAMRRSLPYLLGSLALLWLGAAFANIRVTVPLWGSDFHLWSWAYKKYPDSPYVQAIYLTTLIHEGDYAGAQRFLSQVGERNDSLRALKAVILIRTGRPEEGTKILQALAKKLSEPPNSGAARPENLFVTGSKGMFISNQSIFTGIAEGQIALRDFEAALVTAQTLTSQYPIFPPGYLWGALAYYGLDRWDEGERYFQRALELYIPPAAGDARILRSQWLDNLCSEPRKPRRTCHAWAEEKKSKRSAEQRAIANH